MTSCWAKARTGLDSASPQARRTRAARASRVPARDMQFFSQRWSEDVRAGIEAGDYGRFAAPAHRVSFPPLGKVLYTSWMGQATAAPLKGTEGRPRETRTGPRSPPT